MGNCAEEFEVDCPACDREIVLSRHHIKLLIAVKGKSDFAVFACPLCQKTINMPIITEIASYLLNNRVELIFGPDDLISYAEETAFLTVLERDELFKLALEREVFKWTT